MLYEGDLPLTLGGQDYPKYWAWTIWRHRNDCVFNGKSPRLASTLIMAGDDSVLGFGWSWRFGSAR
jgi:hypothetical protein